MDAKKIAKDNLIYSTITGSTAYGTNLPTSDTDIRHLFCLPKELRENPFLNIENVQDKEQDDAEYDELKKFLILVTNANPNKIELLFTNPEHHLFVHPAMQPLLENRDLFLTKRIRHTFGGYAFSQKARMERHLRWIQKLEHKTERERYKEAPKLVRYILWVDDEGMEHSLKDFSTEELVTEFFSKVFATKVNNALYKLYLKNDQVPSVFFSDVNCENPSFIDISLQRLQELKPEYKGFAYINFEAYQTDLKEYNHYLEWRQNRNKDRASLEVSHGYDCYSEDTEFLTDSGWKKFEEVTEQDCLATVYIARNEIARNRKMLGVEYQKPIDKFHGFFTGEMYNLFGNHVDVFVTPNHRMLFQKKERRSQKLTEWVLEEASNLPDTFNILRAVSPLTKTNNTPEQLQNHGISALAIMRLMGWYLSDGCIQKAIRISQKRGGKIYWQMSRFYGEYKDKIPCSFYKSLRKPNILRKTHIVECVLAVRSKSLVKMFGAECGHGSFSKRIPRWVFGLSLRLKQALLVAMLGGDGTIRQTNLKTDIYYTASKDLANDIQELALLCGFETSLYGPYKTNNTQYPHALTYHVHINRKANLSKTCIRSANIKKVLVENQRIVCFTVPNGTLITRRNGHVGIHGNSKHAMHCVRLLRMAKEILLEGKVIVKRPDAQELIGIRQGSMTLQEIFAYMQEMEQNLQIWHDKSPLPKTADQVKIAKAYQECLGIFYASLKK